MRILLSLALLFTALSANAQLVISQSSPDIKWYTISNNFVEVIYPDYLASESTYIANLVNHYSQFVGKTYGIDAPKQFHLVIRPEMAQPNGFVTLAPRRSEWFTSSVYSPITGASEWYQTLAIHEYRHVNQFDHFNRSTVKVLQYIMGDFGVQFAAGISLPSWYLEGDAVWAETKYTDAGRGRSPRFLSRLKALVLSDKIPTYDQFLLGSYKTDIPNQYVYGYALVSYGTQKYGDDFWKKMTEKVSVFPHPLRLYTAFYSITGQSFESFYNEAMLDLRNKWGGAKNENAFAYYRDESQPQQSGESLYFVREELESHATIYKKAHGKSEKVFEIPYNRELVSISIRNDKLIYTEYLPDRRYGYKGSADLFVVDLKTKDKTRLTTGLRLYNSSLNKAGDKIVAVQFTADQKWAISQFDLQGKQLDTFVLPDVKVSEAKYLDDSTAIAVINSKTGTKSLVRVDLKSKSVSEVLIPSSRNLINSVYTGESGDIVFEAQLNGANEIFHMSSKKEISRCTFSDLSAFTPSISGSTIFYSKMDTHGALIDSVSVESCKPVSGADLVDFKYLGSSPSDNYNGFPPQAFTDQEALYTKNQDQYKVEDYGDFDSRLFIPHTWGFGLGRGSALTLRTDSYLGTMSIEGNIGSDPEEGKAYSSLAFGLKKYYPIVNIFAETRGREVEDFDSEDFATWTEKTAGLEIVVPYIKQRGYFGFSSALTLGGAYMDASEYGANGFAVDGSNYFYRSYGQAAFAWKKNGTYRSLREPWLLSYRIRYENAERPGEEELSSFRVYQQAIAQTPGFTKVDGFMFTFDQETQKDSLTSYRFRPEVGVANGYAFSRGYKYEHVPGYQKLSGNYSFPISYPDISVGRFYYLKRTYGNVFFDSTVVQDREVQPTLNSAGAELYLESRLFRILPVTFGVRYMHLMRDSEDEVETFMSSALGF